ncbi:MAG TPA: protein-glutamine glutaminase family protein [Oculatellaceae cyanobacterium]|jgi:hypothetical protein
MSNRLLSSNRPYTPYNSLWNAVSPLGKGLGRVRFASEDALMEVPERDEVTLGTTSAQVAEPESTETKQPPHFYSWEQACRLTREMSALPLPWRIYWYCGPKANIMLSHMLQKGISESALGVIQACLADCSPSNVEASEEGKADSPYAKPPFSPQLSAKVRELLEKDIVYLPGINLRLGKKGILLTKEDEDRTKLNFQKRASWELPWPHEKSRFWNHIAPTIRVKKGRNVEVMVIDPGVNTERPLSISEWHRALNCSSAVALTNSLGREDACQPSYICTELLSDVEAKRLQTIVLKQSGVKIPLDGLASFISNQPKADYARIVTEFFRLKPQDDGPNLTRQYIRYYARLLCLEERYLFKEKLYDPKAVKAWMNFLQPFLTYQRWLEDLEKSA